MGLKITVFMCSWGKFWTKDTKRPKNPTATSEEPGAEQKQGVGSKSRVLSMPPALNTTRGVGKTPKPPLWPNAWTHPYPHPI